MLKVIRFLGEEGTYNPFPEHSYGGIYYTEIGENDYPKKILVKDVKRAYNPFPIFFNISTDAKRELREFIFENCTGVTSLARNYFTGLNYLQNVVLSSGITSIDNEAFNGCSSLQTINLPSSLTSIGDNTFSGCSSLQTINLPSSLTSIGAYAFYICSSLQTINIPSGVTSIKINTFNGCSSLQTINLPSSLTSIGQGGFNGCRSLQTINLPSSLTSIGGYAFFNCFSLQFVTIENGFNCNNLNLSDSTRFSAETILSWFNALADRTGETAYTLTIGSTNLNKMTTEEKAIAINKNWNLN